MNKSAIIAALLLCFSSVQAQEVESQENAAPAVQSENDQFCLFKGAPPSDFKYTAVGEVKYGKGTYGSAASILPEVVEQARAMGGTAIINYSGAQHFGFWPWRMVRPVIKGTAIKWKSDQPFECASVGAMSVSQALAGGNGPNK